MYTLAEFGSGSTSEILQNARKALLPESIQSIKSELDIIVKDLPKLNIYLATALFPLDWYRLNRISHQKHSKNFILALK